MSGVFSQAPDWADGDVCHRCRAKFTTFTRQVGLEEYEYHSMGGGGIQGNF